MHFSSKKYMLVFMVWKKKKEKKVIHPRKLNRCISRLHWKNWQNNDVMPFNFLKNSYSASNISYWSCYCCCTVPLERQSPISHCHWILNKGRRLLRSEAHIQWQESDINNCDRWQQYRSLPPRFWFISEREGNFL